MHRTLEGLSELEQSFIDAVYIQCKTYAQTAALLKVDITEVRQLNNALEPYWRPITKIRDKWKSKKIDGNFWDFCHWYKTAEQHCHYCGVTQDELNQLHQPGLINKRTTRGKTLEIDRKIASESYSNILNLVFACYWCNNAKTDTFTEEEFKIIGQAIKSVWEKRLGS